MRHATRVRPCFFCLDNGVPRAALSVTSNDAVEKIMSPTSQSPASQSTAFQSSTSDSESTSATTPGSMPHLPGIDNYLCTGFNLKQAANCNVPLFEFTYVAGNTVAYGASDAATYTYPDQLDVTTTTDSNEYRLDTTMRSEEEFNNRYALSMKVNGSSNDLDFNFAGSASVALTGSSDTLEWSENEYFLNAFRCQTYSVTRISDGAVSGQFTTELGKLTPTSSYETFEQFFDTCGTHYVVSGNFGGQMVATTSISKSLFSKHTASKVTSEVSASFSDLVTNGSFSESDMFANSEFLKDNRSSISVSIKAVGGLFDKDETTYMQSCFSNPALLLCPYGVASQTVEFKRITCLVADQALRSAIDAALTTYLPAAAYPLIQPLAPIAADTQIAQHADGFVIGTINCLAEDGARGTLTGATGNQVTAECSAHYYQGDDRWVSSASYLLPVHGGSSSVNTTDATCLNPAFSLFQTEFQSAKKESFFGEWVTVPAASSGVATDFTPASDGFLLINASISSDGDRGSVIVSQNWGSGKLMPLAACSVHQYHGDDVWYPAQSFCIPVRQGEALAIISDSTSGSPSFSYQFLPLDSSLLSVGQSSTVQANTAYQAAQDGFLVCALAAGQDGSRGTASLVYAGSSQAALQPANAQIGTSVHNYHTDNEYMRFNTAVLPVTKGRWYAANVDNTCETIDATIYFVPIARAGA